MLRRRTIISGMLLLSMLQGIYNQAMAKNRRVVAHQPAPAFTTTDVNGQTVKLEHQKGRKVLLSFHRNVGCPICNLRFHELEKLAASQPGLTLLAVYESSAAHMRQYMDGAQVRAVMIPDTAQVLYDLYGVERSKAKIMKGMFHGAMGKMTAGNKLFKHRIKQDGNMDRIGAEFLIDEQGNVLIAHYDSYVGDHLPVADIIHAIEQQ